MNEITSYIENCRKKGFSDRYIKKVLKDAGHQEFVVRRAFSMSKRKDSVVGSRNLLYSVFIIVGIVALLSVVFMINSENDSAPTGQVIQPIPIAPDMSTNDELIKTKNLIISQQTDMINALDLTVDEKNILIMEQTAKINAMFNDAEMQREEMVKASLELANSILKR